MKVRINSLARLPFPFFTAIVMMLSARPAHAGQIWDGTGADNNWNTPANWDGDTLPNFANAITFTGATRLTAANNLTAGTTIGGINFTNTATNAFTLSGNAITLGGNIVTTAASAALADTISLAMATTAARTITTNTNHHLIISGVISGTGGSIVKNGGGILTLTGTNTFTGAADIAAGTVRAGNASALGANTTINSNSTSTNTVLAATGASALSFSRNVSLNTGGGAITFGDAVGTGNLTFTGNLTRASGATNRTINVAGSTTVTFNSNLLSPGASAATTFFKGGTGTLSILGTGSATDPGFSQIVVTAGSLGVTRLANLGSASSLGAGTAATPGNPSIILDGGELRYISGGVVASSTDRLLQIGRTTDARSGTVRNDATNPLETVTFSNPGAIAYGTLNQTRTLVLRGTNTGANTIASMIGDNDAAAVSLNKLDAGTWLLTGTNTYSGATTISDGSLELSGTGSVNNSLGITVDGINAKLVQNSSVAALPLVTVTQGTVTGSGILGTVNVGTGGIISNNNGVAGAGLTIGALNFSGTASINTYHAPGEFASAIAATTISTDISGIVTLNPSAPSWNNGTYNLLSYTGTIGGAGAGQIALGTVANLSARQSASALTNTGSAFTISISGDTAKWTGADDGNWQIGSTGPNENWRLVLGGTPVSFLANDDVLFDDTATGSTALNITSANVATFGIVFNNSSKNYTLGSTGGFGISTGSLTKSGTGSLTITNTNTFTGPTVINGGVLDVSTDGAQLYSAAAAVNSSVTVTNGGVLVVKSFAQANTSGPGSPSLGNLANNGGQVIIDGGTLRFNNETASRGRVINVGPNGATFDVLNGSTYTWTTSPGTTVPFSGSDQTLTLTGDTTSTGRINLIIGGNNVSVLKTGEATWTLGGANTFTGGTTISGGTLAAAVAGALGSGTITNNAVLNLTAGAVTYTGLSSTSAGALSGTGTINVTLGTGTGTTALNGNYSDFTGTWNVGVGAAAGAGKVQMNGADNAGATINVLTNGTLYASAAGAIHNAAIVLNGGDTGESIGQLRIESNGVWAGPVTLAGTITGTNDGFVGNNVAGNIGIISGPIGETGGPRDFSKVGAGTIVLTGTSTYSGATTIAAGVLQLGDGTSGNDGTISNTSGVTNNGTLIFNRFGSTAAAYPIGGTGAIVKNGSGTQALGGLNTFAGTTRVNAGILTLDYSTQDNSKLSDTAALTLAGGTLNLSGGTHTEVVASTSLAAGTFSTVSRTSGTAILQMGNIIPQNAAYINFAQSGIATTDTLNNPEGYIGAWATVNGTDLAVNSTNGPNGLIISPSYTDVTRLSSGNKAIPDNSAAFVRIIEGTGAAAPITLAAATTSLSTLTQSAQGGNSPALINFAGRTMATSAIFSATGAGAITLGNAINDGFLRTLAPATDLSINNNDAGTVTIHSVIADNGGSGLIKSGNGTLVLNGNNTYAYDTVLTDGSLVLGNPGALGVGRLTIQGGSLDSSVPNLVNANNNAQQWNANITFAGSNNLNLGTGAVTTNAARTITVAANTLTVGGSITPSANANSHLTKLGNGTLDLTGETALGNNGIIVNGGTVRFSGNLTTNTGAGAAGNTFRIGNLTNASAAWVQTGGSVALSVNDVDGMNLGNADNAPNAFGSMTIAGGTFSAPRINVGGSGVSGGTNGVGVLNLLNGGSAAFSAYFIGGRTATSTGSATIAGGTLDLSNSAIVNGRIGAWGGGRFEVNLGANLGGLNSGGLINTGANPYSAVASNAASQGIVSLLGGTLLTNAITSLAGTSTGVGINQINFNGGILKYSGSAANAAFLNAIPAGAAGASGVFVRSGGAIIDNSGQSITIAAALLAPTGGEIKSISVTGAEAPGTFFTAPYVRITGGNNDATAIATIKADGSLDSIIVTNPGSGYSSNPPTVTLVGGTHSGGSGTVTGSADATVGDSVSGGITKLGAGYLTISGNNTYAGVTTIEGGSITLNSATPNPNTVYDVKSGAQAYGGWAVAGATFPNDFTIAGIGFSEGGINVGAIRSSNNQTYSGTITLASDSRIGMIETNAACTFSGRITGDFGLDIQGAHSGNSGTQTINFSNGGTPNDYAGNTTLSTVGYGGARTGATTILRLGGDEQIPHGADKGDLVLNGPDSNNLTVLELDGYNETINGLSNANAAGAIIRNTGPVDSILSVGGDDADGNFSGVISDSGTGRSLALTKIGTGTLTLSGVNTYTGPTTVTAGTLSLVGGSQASPVTVSAGASLGFTLDSPTTSTSTFNLGAGTIKITGTPTLASHTLITTSNGITGTPVLETPIPGYALVVSGNALNLVRELGGYSSWASVNAIGSAPGMDKDGDGVTNAIEYVLGGLVTTNDLDKAPTVDASGANLVFSFKRDRNSIDGNTTVRIEIGDNLTGWPQSYNVGTTTETSDPGVTVAANTPAGFDTITLTVAKGTDLKKFARLKVNVTE